jgi:hypothetical protein
MSNGIGSPFEYFNRVPAATHWIDYLASAFKVTATGKGDPLVPTLSLQ